MNALKTQILTPNGQIFEGEVEGVQVPGELGSFEIKKNHASIVSLLDIGPLRIQDDAGKSYHFAVNGGFVEVDNNNIIVMAESAELKDNIDFERAKEAAERAQKRIVEANKETDTKRAEMALKRAVNRLKLADL